MAAPSRAQLLDTVYTLLKKRYKLEPKPERLGVLEAVVYGICHEGTTREQANQALGRFKDGFFDWNEVRVSPVVEIEEALAGLPDPGLRAGRLRRFLRQLFVKTYGFTLDALAKKPQKEALKALQEFEAMGIDYVQATVLQQALGGHAIPVDAPMRRALERLGIAEPGGDEATLRASLERAVAKNRGPEFADLMEELSHDTCVAGEPDCPRCELKKVCPTGGLRLAALKTSARAEAKAAATAKAAEKAPPKAGRPAPVAEPAPKPAAKAVKTKGPRPK